MLWASSSVVGLNDFGGFSILKDCVSCWGSQAGARGRSGLAHPSPHTCHPPAPGVTLSTSQSRKHGSLGVSASTKRIFPSFHPKTPLLLPAGSQQTGWGEYLGSVLPARGEDTVGNAFSHPAEHPEEIQLRVSFWVFALISGFSKTLIYSIISEHHICARDKRMGGLLAGGLSQQGCCGGHQPWAWWFSWGVGGVRRDPQNVRSCVMHGGSFPPVLLLSASSGNKDSAGSIGTLNALHAVEENLLGLWLRLCGFWGLWEGAGPAPQASRQNPLALHHEHPHRAPEKDAGTFPRWRHKNASPPANPP